MSGRMPSAEKMRLARERAGLREDAAAEQLHVDRSTLNRYENGRRVPSWAQVRVMALIYATSEEYLYDETDDPVPKEFLMRLDPENKRELQLLSNFRLLEEKDREMICAITDRMAELNCRQQNGGS